MKTIFPILFILLTVLSSNFLVSAEIRLFPPHHTFSNPDGQLFADFKAISDLINDETRQHLKYGVSMHFVYFIEFKRQSLFLDETVSQRQIQKTIKYDIWNDRYVLILDSGKKRYFSTIRELEEAVLKLESVKIINLSNLKKDDKYYFRTRITAKVADFKSYFHIIFSFLSIFKYKTTYLYSESEYPITWSNYVIQKEP